MDYRRQQNGLLTFLEHWSVFLMIGVAFLASQVLDFFTELTGGPWILCYTFSLVIAGVGVALIFYAKLPLYRQSRFFTFGTRALSEDRRPFYRWGYRCAVFAVALLLFLLLSRP